jgi:hypothetical protein
VRIGGALVNARAVERRGGDSRAILRLALTAPERLTTTAAAVVAADLQRPQTDRTVIGALGALAALLYARPDLVRPSLVGSLARVTAGVVSPGLATAAAEAWQVLATSPVAGRAARGLIDVLGRRRLAPAARRPLLAALAAYARWRPDTLSLDATLRAAGAGPDATALDVILCQVIEPLIFTSPRAFTRARVDRLATIFAGRARLRYTLGRLVSRAGLPAGAKRRARRWLAPRLRPMNVPSTLGEKPCATLVIHNITDGQGDELVRVVPLLQSLLDVSSRLTATVLTRRSYLYDHARVTASPIQDDAAVDHALGARWDAIVDFNARTVPGVSTRPELEARVADYLAAHRLALVIRAVAGRHHHTFETVRVGDRSVARSVGLDRTDFENAYDASERLLIDLGLPLRPGRDDPGADSVLAGTRSGEAEAAWRRLRGRGLRPAALVNGFGGTHPLKGFTQDKAARLGAEIGGLVDEGYTAILLPNGEPWGRTETIMAALSHVGHRRLSHVRIAPDPAEPGEAPSFPGGERPEVTGADRVMRQFKYFARYADLVVTVEGWLMHLAYALGRPFRLFMAPSSPVNWLPTGRGPHQRLVVSMSRLSGLDVGDLLRDDDPPAQPSYARKLMLMAAARALGALPGAGSHRLLLRILASPDPELRAVAVDALASDGLTSAARARLHEALDDEAALVRAAAARALLREAGDAELRRDPRHRRRLHAHVAIARQDWSALLRLGAAALPALAATARDPDPILRREARWVAAHLLRRHVAAASRTTSPRPGRAFAPSTHARDARRPPA